MYTIYNKSKNKMNMKFKYVNHCRTYKTKRNINFTKTDKVEPLVCVHYNFSRCVS